MGRPSELNEFQLLQWEAIWIARFYNLRNGSPETQVKTRGSSGVMIKVRPENEKVFTTSSEGEAREHSGRETVHTTIVREKTKTLRQPRIMESEKDMEEWQKKVKDEEEKFRRITMGLEPNVQIIPAQPHERHIWEALKRARTAAQVRAAFSQSKIWLISRIDFPGGRFMDWSWSPMPMALHRHADLFCKAKLDPRYPRRDARESGDFRRIEYLGRVMAGLSLDKPISPSYSVEILRKMKHRMTCSCWRCKYKLAPCYPRSVVQFLRDGSLPEKWLGGTFLRSGALLDEDRTKRGQVTVNPVGSPPPVARPSNRVVCGCGTSIHASTQDAVLRELARHQRNEHPDWTDEQRKPKMIKCECP